MQRDSVPAGLTTAEWHSIQDQIALSAYHFTPSESGTYTAPNRIQGWQTQFGPQGIQVSAANDAWTWALIPTGYGYSDTMKDLTGFENLSSVDETLTTQWDTNLSEWWINSAAGLEQGFSLQQRPDGQTQGQPLQIDMAVSGSLTPVMDGGDVLFQDAAGETILRYDRLHVVDANGKTIPAQLALSAEEKAGVSGHILQIMANDAHAAYPLTIDPWLQQAKLTANDAAAADLFGEAVAVSGDTAVIGARYDDDSASASGSAYVFVRIGAAWSQQAKLTANDAAAADLFGEAVAVSGDTAVIGAYQDDDTASNSGSAYVFVRSGTTWSQQAKLTASDAAASDYFGYSVAVDGNTAVIGASLDDDDGSTSGSAYVFVRIGAAWSQQAKLTAGDAAAFDYFGYAVAVSGNTAVIGAPYDDDGGSDSDSGSTYVFVRSGTTWSQQAKLVASDAVAADDAFGYAVAVSGDTAVIGAYQDDDTASNSGSAYVFVRSGTTWSQQAKLTASDAAASDYFGYSVAVDGNTAVIGASLDDDDGSTSGSAYVFVRIGAAWSQQAKLTTSDAAAYDKVGYAVAVSGDTAVIGANGNDDGGDTSGSAYVFALSPPPTLTVSLAGAGSGSVTSNPVGINCGSDCTEDFAEDTVVTLTATPHTGSTFSGWSGACTNSSGVCVVTMAVAKSVTATFTLKTYALTVSLAGTASGSVTSSPVGINCGSDCSETYNYGTVVTLTATAGENALFDGWSGACTGMAQCVVTIDEAKNVTATFKKMYSIFLPILIKSN